MRLITLLIFVVLGTCVRAQTTSTSTSVQESESDTRYSFHVKTNKISDRLLNATFGEIAEVEVNGKFSGDWHTEDEYGIEYSMHTRRNYLRIDYRGDDPAAMARAKEKANVVRRRFDL